MKPAETRLNVLLFLPRTTVAPVTHTGTVHHEAHVQLIFLLHRASAASSKAPKARLLIVTPLSSIPFPVLYCMFFIPAPLILTHCSPGEMRGVIMNHS